MSKRGTEGAPELKMKDGKYVIPDDLEQRAILEETKKAFDQLTLSQEEVIGGNSRPLPSSAQIDSIDASPIFSPRGAQTFNYDEIHREYNNKLPIFRSMSLPYCKEKLRANNLAVLFFSPILALTYHGYRNLSKRNPNEPRSQGPRSHLFSHLHSETTLCAEIVEHCPRSLTSFQWILSTV